MFYDDFYCYVWNWCCYSCFYGNLYLPPTKKDCFFERRAKILNDFENFIFDILPNWDWDGSAKLVEKYSEKEIAALFNNEYVNLQKDILQVANNCNTLMGDIEHAKEHGSCHSKTETELEEEKITCQNELGERFRKKIRRSL